jgi:hypothetical protein
MPIANQICLHAGSHVFNGAHTAPPSDDQLSTPIERASSCYRSYLLQFIEMSDFRSSRTDGGQQYTSYIDPNGLLIDMRLSGDGLVTTAVQILVVSECSCIVESNN